MNKAFLLPPRPHPLSENFYQGHGQVYRQNLRCKEGYPAMLSGKAGQATPTVLEKTKQVGATATRAAFRFGRFLFQAMPKV